MLPRAVGLLPTYNRPKMAHRAAHLWLEQDYAGQKTLLVFDDGEEPATFCASCTAHVEVVHHARRNLPHKRNAMMELVGDEDAIYFLWDDDDYHGPRRVSRQVSALAGGAAACIMRPTLYYNSITGEVATSSWISDGTVAFTWAFWSRRRFDENTDPGSGFRFVNNAGAVEIPGELDYCVVVHAGQRHTPPAFGLPDFTDAPVSAEWAMCRLALPG
jgi:glycosyltransferase involved in cell wall biosynthesis